MHHGGCRGSINVGYSTRVEGGLKEASRSRVDNQLDLRVEKGNTGILIVVEWIKVGEVVEISLNENNLRKLTL